MQLTCYFHLSVCLCIMDPGYRVREKKAGFLDEMLPEAIEHFVQGPCYQLGGSQKDPSSHWRI